LAAGHDVKPFIRALEGYSSSTGLLPEQVWDEADRLRVYMFLGRPTGSAMPLMWAHAEYIKLLRSAADGHVFDLIPEGAERYLSSRNPRRVFEVWKHNRQPRHVKNGHTLPVQPRSVSPALVGRWHTDLLERHLEFISSISQFRRSSEHRFDSHSFGRMTAPGNGAIIWWRSNCRSNRPPRDTETKRNRP
jgi:hypothetical protein